MSAEAPRPPFERYRDLVDDWDAFQASIHRPLPRCVWTNTIRSRPEVVREHLQSAGIEATPLAWYPGAFRVDAEIRVGKAWPVVAGLCHVQEEISLLPIRLLAPRPEERILDLCAAPGNKTAAIAVALRNGGTVVANDISYVRMRAVRHIVERLGLVNISTTAANGANYPSDAGTFDRVLVDVPCSCEGTCRKSPEVLEESRHGEYRKKIRVQRALLTRAIQLCRPGGRIVYATCTFAPEENEVLVDSVLRHLGATAPRVIEAPVEGLRTSPGITSWKGRELDPSLRHALRVWPHHNDTGGFFAVLLEATDPARATQAPLAPPDGEPVLDEAASATLAAALDRFGIPASALDPYAVERPVTRGLYLRSRDHVPPPIRQRDATGLFFVRTDARFPRPTTAAAMLLGPHATRNIVDVDDDQVASYVHRRDTVVDASQLTASTGTGHVFVRYRGSTIGTALYRPGEDGASGTLESQFPKGWSMGLGEGA